MSDLNLEAIRNIVQAELAPVNAQLQLIVNQLASIERKLDLTQDLDFLSRNETAQEVISALKLQNLRRQPVKPPPPESPIPIPGLPGNRARS